MAKIEDDKQGEPASPQAGLVKCPHCGRLVPRGPGADGTERSGAAGRQATGEGNVFRCPNCGLEIKERHLA
jgi:predicted RNA-binding Zn-ribbon protein involved in translation (DUF1610 family)